MANQQDQEMDSNDRPETSGTTDEIAQLREELKQQKSDFQSIEVALISRIADVDDDRRHAATRLQRTLQNHREEMDGRIRHQNVIVTITFILFVVIVGILLIFAYAKFDQARQTFSTEVQELRQTLEEVESSISEPQDQEQEQTPATREKLSQLSKAVKTITASLERLADEQELLVTSVTPAPSNDRVIDPTVEPQQISAPAPRAPESAKVPEKAAEPTAEPAVQASTQPAETAPEADDASTQNASVDAIAETPFDSTEATPDEETQPKPALETAPATTATPPPEPAPEPDMQTPTEETETTAPETTETVEPEAPPSERMSVGDTPYSVQLMGFYSLDSLLTFARRHGLNERPVYDEESYQGRPWFVLIHSLHATKEDAEAAVAILPPELAKRDIWIRKLEPDATIYRPAPRTE